MTDFRFDLFRDDIEVARAVKEAREAPRPLPAIVPLPDSAEMPQEFARSTMLALRTQQDILAMPMPDEDDPHYKAKLAAKAAVSSAQVSAQLRCDETAVKMQIAATSIYDEIKQAIKEYRDKERLLSSD